MVTLFGIDAKEKVNEPYSKNYGRNLINSLIILMLRGERDHDLLMYNLEKY